MRDVRRAPAPKGDVDSESVAVSLKRYPDTNKESARLAGREQIQNFAKALADVLKV